MQNNIIHFIVVHDPTLIQYFESIGKYKVLTNYKYLLVGKHKLDYRNEIIIQCELLDNNIEYHKYYLAYTAWYALANNPEIIGEYKYVTLLEYDTDIRYVDEINFMYSNILSKDMQLYGMHDLPINVGFLDRSVFNDKLIKYFIKSGHAEITPNNKTWIVSNNVCFKKEFLLEYFNDELTKNLLTILNNDRMSGHFLERYLSAYCFIKGIKYGFIDPCCFEHMALDSHDTQGRKGEYEKFRETNNI